MTHRVRAFQMLSGVLNAVVISLLVAHPQTVSLALVTTLINVMFLAINRVPLQRMNLNVAVTSENAQRVENVVRPHLAAIGTVTMALFAWLSAAIAFHLIGLYLATFWLFLIAIAALATSMIVKLPQAA